MSHQMYIMKESQQKAILIIIGVIAVKESLKIKIQWNLEM